MTNYQYIKQLTVQEIAEYFANMFDCNLCEQHQELSDCPLLNTTQCDNNCILHCQEWLNSEVEE